MKETGAFRKLVPGEVFAGKFRLDHQIAAGGMGFVWRAWNLQLEVPVAVKVMATALAESPEFVARFELEAKAAAQIRSPHVVNVYEHGVHERLPYMVMELLEGETLSERLEREKRLSMAATARIVRDICKALHRAHELGIVHRDLKPANVFLARDGDDETVKVLDFGIAKLTQGGRGGFVTATGELMGTPSYMSPEQIQASKHVDHRADLWSLSIIVFRALTGQRPYSGQIYEVASEILTGPVPVPSAVAPDLSPAVDAFFARALARDISGRFQSARELSSALRMLAESEPTASRSPSTTPDVEAEAPPPIAAPRSETEPALSPEDAPPNSTSDAKTVLMNARASQEPETERETPSNRATHARPPLRSRSWIVGVIRVVALVAVAVALWAVLRHRDGPGPTPAPLPAGASH